MRSGTWLAVGKLGAAFAQVVAGEWQQVRREMRNSARVSAGAALTIVVGLAFLVVALSAFMLATVEGLTSLLPRWLAFLGVGGVLALIAFWLIMAGRRRLKQVETPKKLAKRRWQEHRSWMRRQLGKDEQPQLEE